MLSIKQEVVNINFKAIGSIKLRIKPESTTPEEDAFANRLFQLFNQDQGWKPSYLALGCQFQFRCVITQMSGFSFGLVSRLLKNRFQFWFQFCLRIASVSGFQFRFKFHPRKLVYFEYGLFKCCTWRFCFITMISSSSDGRVRRAIASEVVDLGIIPSPVKSQLHYLTLSIKRAVLAMLVMTIFKT